MEDQRAAESRAREPSSVDLGVVLGWTVAAVIGSLVPPVQGTVLAFGLGIPLVLLLPGYAVLAAAFPDAADPTGSGARMDGRMRVGLALPVSLAIVPLGVGLLAWTPWGIGATGVVLVLAGVTIAGVVVAAVRRRRRPPDERAGWRQGRLNAMVRSGNRVDRTRAAGVVFLGTAILVATGTMAFALAMPPADDGTAQFYVGTPTPEGDVVAGEYPREFTVGEGEPLVVAVEHDRPAEAAYAVVVTLEVVERPDGDPIVTERDELDRFETDTLERGESWAHEHEVVPDRSGEELRVVYLLYEGDAPDDPDPDTADDRLQLTIAVDG